MNSFGKIFTLHVLPAAAKLNCKNLDNAAADVQERRKTPMRSLL